MKIMRVPAFLAFAALSMAQTAGLPVKRAVLYKTGVGYFEHLGNVTGPQQVSIQFTEAQLNDVLKSLTVLDLNGGRIAGVNYASAAPIERRIAELRLPPAGKAGLTEFLNSLRGARMEVRGGTGAVTGRLLSIERKTRSGGGTTLEVDHLSLVTDSGEIKTAELTPNFGVKLLDRGTSARVGRYMDLVAEAREADARRMIVSTAGGGTRQVFVSYISEVPVWKSTYRLVMPSKPGAKPLIQGWAIVDNTAGEDWTNIELSLAAGAPQSFVQHLSQPHYSRRPVVRLPEMLSSVPQEHEATLDTGSGSGASGVLAVEGRAPEMQTENASIDVSAGRSLGTGSRLGRTGKPGGIPPPPPLPQRPSGAIEEARVRTEVRTTARELGDLFEYKIQDPVTIPKGQSALVPILQSQFDMERITVWTPSRPDSRPERGLWLRNTTGLTLDGGTFNVTDGEAFAGEGIFEAIRPGERRIVTYAADLALAASSREETQTQRVSRAALVKGTLTLTNEVREKRIYTLRNEDTQPRNVIIEHPVRSGWTARGSIKPEETSRGWHRYRLTVQPKQTASLEVEEARPKSTTYAIHDVTDTLLVALVSTGAVDKQIEASLRLVIEKKNAVADLEAKEEVLQKESQDIFDDQARLRENIKSLGATPDARDLVQRYTSRLNQQEDRLEVIKKESAVLAQRKEAAGEELQAVIGHLAAQANDNAR